MNHTAYGLSAEAQNFNWLLGKFAAETAGVHEAIAVSSDGLLMAMSAGQERAGADPLAANTSGITSHAGGAARAYPLGPRNQVDGLGLGIGEHLRHPRGRRPDPAADQRAEELAR